MSLRAIAVEPRTEFVLSWWPGCLPWQVLFGFERGIYDSLDAWIAEMGIAPEDVALSRYSASFNSQLDALLCLQAFREVKAGDDGS